MNEQEQRIAIAEACGWTNVQPTVIKNVAKIGDDRTVGIWSDSGWIPDYLNDLNAMHEAEKVLMEENMNVFIPLLCQMTISKVFEDAWWDLLPHEAFRVAHATAAQRAEAFLKTLNIWTDQ